MSHLGVWEQGYCCFYRDAVFPAKAGIHVPPPSGTAGQSILRATPQMSSFRRKPESTYPQPSGTEGCRQPTGNSQSRLSGESRNPRTPTLRDGRSIHPTGNSPDVVFPAKAGIHVSPTLRDRRLPPAYGQLPESSFRRKPESTYPDPQGRRVNPSYGQLPRCRLYYENRRQAASRVTLWPRRWSWRTERRVMAARSRSSK